MNAKRQTNQFWVNWLLLVSSGVVLFGLFLVVLPESARKAFSVLVYSTPHAIDTFGTEQVRYISLTHAVLGGVMVGWGSTMFLVVKDLLQEGHPTAWFLITIPVFAWFVPDTVYSLLSGFWQNALLNSGFLVLFAVPLWAIKGEQKNGA